MGWVADALEEQLRTLLSLWAVGWTLHPRGRGLDRLPGGRALALDAAAEELAILGGNEPVTLRATKGDAGDGARLWRIDGFAGAAGLRDERDAAGICDVDIAGGVVGDGCRAPGGIDFVR